MLKDLKINKNDMIILSIILVISILTKISTFYYPIGGDTVVYLNLAEEINNNLSYNLNNSLIFRFLNILFAGRLVVFLCKEWGSNPRSITH